MHSIRYGLHAIEANKQREHEPMLEIEDGTNQIKDSETSLAELTNDSSGLLGDAIGAKENPNTIAVPQKTEEFQTSNTSETSAIDQEMAPKETESSQGNNAKKMNDGLVDALMKEINDLELEVKSLLGENNSIKRNAEIQTELLNSVLNQNTTLNYEKRELERTLNDCQTRCRLLERKSEEANTTCEIVIKQNEQNNKDRGNLQKNLCALSEEKERIQRENEQLKRKPAESKMSCGICFEAYITEWQAISVCGHVFCGPCIDKLGIQNGKKNCPTCRFEFRDYERIKVFF